MLPSKKCTHFLDFNSKGELPASQSQRLLLQRGAVLHSILLKRNGTRSRLPHSSIPSFWKKNDDPPNHDDPNYDRLWKIRNIFDTLNNKFGELYNPTEHLAVDEAIVLYKRRVVFQQYIPKKHKRFGIKIYKLCDSLGYTYDMSMYLGKQRKHATVQITAKHRTVLQVIRRVEGLGHKIFRTIISPCLLCLMICSNEKSMHVEHFAMTSVECEILGQNL